MFSKVSQSLALVNSVSTLLNKGGIACRRPTASQDFCASAKQTQTLTATFAPALHLTTRVEARVGGNSCRQSFRATHTSSWMLTGIVKCFKAHPMPTQNYQSMPKHATAMFMLVQTQTVKVSEKLSSRKSFLKEVRNSTVARESLCGGNSDLAAGSRLRARKMLLASDGIELPC